MSNVLLRQTCDLISSNINLLMVALGPDDYTSYIGLVRLFLSLPTLLSIHSPSVTLIVLLQQIHRSATNPEGYWSNQKYVIMARILAA